MFMTARRRREKNTDQIWQGIFESCYKNGCIDKLVEIHPSMADKITAFIKEKETGKPAEETKE